MNVPSPSTPVILIDNVPKAVFTAEASIEFVNPVICTILGRTVPSIRWFASATAEIQRNLPFTKFVGMSVE